MTSFRNQRADKRQGARFDRQRDTMTRHALVGDPFASAALKKL
jgi:hypothetical protein